MGFLNYTFDWSVLWRHPYGNVMLNGILTTLSLSSLAWFMAVLLGVIVCIFRVSSSLPLRFAGGVYVQIFRNTPFLVQLFFWYFAAPLMLPKPSQAWLYENVPDYSFWAGTLALGTYTASRVAELIRAGISAIPSGQYQAAYSTGLKTLQVYRYIIIPYAFRVIIPSFTTEFLTCFKNSALTMTIGVMETTHAAYYIDSFTWHGLETTTAASITYLCISGCVVVLMARIEKRIRIPGLINRGN